VHGEALPTGNWATAARQASGAVAVSTAALNAGESFAKVVSGQSSTHTLAFVVTLPTVTTLAADLGHLDHGDPERHGERERHEHRGLLRLRCQSGLWTNVAGTPTPVTGSSPTPVSVFADGTEPRETYHFRVNGTSGGGTANGGDVTFTTPGTTPQTITFNNPGTHYDTDAPFALIASASPSGLPVSFSILSALRQ